MLEIHLSFAETSALSRSADHGCLATAEATNAQAPERFGKKEKAARLPFSTTCEWPMAPKSVYTGRDKATVTNNFNFCVSTS